MTCWKNYGVSMHNAIPEVGEGRAFCDKTLLFREGVYLSVVSNHYPYIIKSGLLNNGLSSTATRIISILIGYVVSLQAKLKIAKLLFTLSLISGNLALINFS